MVHSHAGDTRRRVASNRTLIWLAPSSLCRLTARPQPACDALTEARAPASPPPQSLADLDCWVNDLALNMGEGAALYIGDENGTLSVYRVVP